MPSRPSRISLIEVSPEQMMEKAGVINIFGCLKDRQRTAEMMNCELRVFLGESREAAYSLNVPQDKEIGRRIVFLDNKKRIFTFLDPAPA